MASKFQSVIYNAINNRCCIEILYQRNSLTDTNRISYIRVEPHLLGVHKKTNNTLLVAYCLPTPEQRTLKQEFKFKDYNTEKILDIKVCYGSLFDPRPSYKPNNNRFIRVFAKVAPISKPSGTKVLPMLNCIFIW